MKEWTPSSKTGVVGQTEVLALSLDPFFSVASLVVFCLLYSKATVFVCCVGLSSNKENIREGRGAGGLHGKKNPSSFSGC